MTGRTALRCHPSSRCDAVRAVAAEAAIAGDALRVRYVLEGDVSQLRVPAPGAPRAADGLWQHTCFEAFVGNARGRYHELNFSPSGEWAAYAFAAYRERAPFALQIEPRIETCATAHTLELSATVPLHALPDSGGESWRVALSAVVEAASGVLSYWALHHPAVRPDFHHAGGFVLTLPIMSSR